MREYFRDAMLTLGVMFAGLQVFLVWHGRGPQVPAAAPIPLTRPIGGLILVAVLFTMAGMLNIAPLLIRRFFPTSILPKDAEPEPSEPAKAPRNNERRQSQTFVLEVEGSQALDGKLSDWRFLLTNCSTRILRYVRLGMVKSEIGAYLIGFKEIPVMQPGEKIGLSYEVFPRREVDKDSGLKPTLWDFALDHGGERGHAYIWYDLSVQYRDSDDSLRDGGLLGVCFDLQDKKLKTEGAEYYRQRRNIEPPPSTTG